MLTTVSTLTAFRLGQQCSNNLLDPHRSRKTYRTSTCSAYRGRKSIFCPEPHIQHRPLFSQNVGPADLCSCIQWCPALSAHFLVPWVSHCRLVCGHKFSGYFRMCSRAKALEPKIRGTTYSSVSYIPRDGCFKHHHRRTNTARTDAYVMATSS